MEQYIDKTAVIAEIEKRKSELHSMIAVLGTFEANTIGLLREVDLYDDILSMLDTLKIKEVDFTNTFIEKAVQWLKEQKEMVGISFQEDFIERFKNYMKGE